MNSKASKLGPGFPGFQAWYRSWLDEKKTNDTAFARTLQEDEFLMPESAVSDCHGLAILAQGAGPGSPGLVASLK